MRKNLLIYFPPNKRTVALETVILEMAKHHNVKVLTLAEKGDFHNYLETMGVEFYYTGINEFNPIKRVIKQTLFLLKFCRVNKIEVIWSHLHPCNLYTVIAQFFISAKVVIFRHHFHAQIKETGIKGINRNERWMEKIISLLASRIVVPSREGYYGMVNYEGISKDKIEIVPYIYNFTTYAKPDLRVVEEIQKNFPCKIRILIAMRMIKLKRHMIVLPILNRLIREGYDIQVLLLDDGEEKNNIAQYIIENELSKRVHILGYKKNIIDYIAASDLILHPSSTEASSSLIKEAGMLEKIVIVNEGVGDFSDYIENGVNGFLVNGKNELEEYESIIRSVYIGNFNECIGENLYNTVHNKFSVSERTRRMYFDLLD